MEGFNLIQGSRRGASDFLIGGEAHEATIVLGADDIHFDDNIRRDFRLSQGITVST
jgi:hypothetical protein